MKILSSKLHYLTVFSFRFNPNTHLVSLVDSMIVRTILEKREYHCDFGFGWFSEPSEELTVVSFDLLVNKVAELLKSRNQPDFNHKLRPYFFKIHSRRN